MSFWIGMESGTISTIHDSGMLLWSLLLNSMFTSVGRSAWSKMMRDGVSPTMRAVSRMPEASSTELHVYMVQSSAMSFSRSHRRVHWLMRSRLPGEDGVMKNMCPTD